MSDRMPGRIWPISLKDIEATVSSHLGPGRVSGNQQGPCFSRQISMYLAKHVGGWSTPRIGRFYNGRHHTTVLHAIGKVERLRKRDTAVDTMLQVLSAALNSEASSTPATGFFWPDSLLDAVAERVILHMDGIQNGKVSGKPQNPVKWGKESSCP